MEEQENEWLSGFAFLPVVVDARLKLIAHLERREDVPSDVIRGARERVGADLVAMLATGLADQWAQAARERVANMKAGRFSAGDPVEFRLETTGEVIEGTFKSKHADVMHLLTLGLPEVVPAANVRAVPESCLKAEQFSELCRAASGRDPSQY